MALYGEPIWEESWADIQGKLSSSWYFQIHFLYILFHQKRFSQESPSGLVILFQVSLRMPRFNPLSGNWDPASHTPQLSVHYSFYKPSSYSRASNLRRVKRYRSYRERWRRKPIWCTSLWVLQDIFGEFFHPPSIFLLFGLTL